MQNIFDQGLLSLIRTEVIASYSQPRLDALKSFQDLLESEDTRNAYDFINSDYPEMSEAKTFAEAGLAFQRIYRSYYEIIWDEIQQGHLKGEYV